MINKFLGLSLLILSFSALGARHPFKEGSWRFEMKATYAVIPFVIEFKFEGKRLTGILRNGKENIPLNDIDLKKDKIKIALQNYENGLELTIQNKETMAGDFVRYNKNPEVRNRVEGKYGPKERYPGKWQRPAADLTGEWQVTLKEEDGKESQGVVILEQKKGNLNGTIMSTTGDYRYFEGYVNDELFEAASFDGVYNYVFKGRVHKGEMEASILANWMTKVTGKKDSKAELPNPYKQTQLKKMSFTFPDINGKKVSLKDPQFADKAVIVNFYGTWCPNCVDETNYLIPWYKENHQRGVEIISLAFERSLSVAEARMQLTKVVKKREIPYTVLLAGSTSEDKPMDKIPGLKNFISFPTTVFLNRKHEVVKVHAGFTGPSTGKHYEEWKKEFNQNVDELLK
jgi:thiol-disulfide isomerase/thioredoxin